MAEKPALAKVLPGFETIRRYTNPQGQVIAKLLPGDFYVTTHDEVLDTVLGSCVSACIRNPKLGIGGMNHFMLPRPSGNGHDTWETGAAGRATRYGSASMEQLINRILKAGGTRADLEVKIFGGGRVLKTLTDVGDHNVTFVREFLKQEGLRVTSEDVGDTCPRHVQYFPLTGRVRVRHLTSSYTRDVASQEQQFLKGLEKTPVAGEIDLF
ncbi:chemoreceptor glutamine deamidase CheD [Peristeroidobacter agariperforans]|uniref:chemoreceptor glutamine deamidase CheD n=1 Tax=Peristeroidobacter agariperforans TaxID=268404 RepID=UPI00101D31D3|nr:chemoreceptor glutamine deamidase CheD [Peristeroidobacter agariperforans]